MAYSTGTIAQGCFGKVYKEKYNDTWAAVKKVPQHLISRKDLERECEIYNQTTHPNIVKLLGNINLRDGKWIIPLEFIFGEDLETTIFNTSKSKILLTPPNKATIILGMCEGLLHLHSKDVVHQDLKPENIMVEHDTNRAVIIDLGLAKFFKYGLNSAIDMGNPAYSAPEILNRVAQRSQMSDVWAMGKIIAELCGRLRLFTPSVCPDKIREVVKEPLYCNALCRMVEENPSRRASMVGVISDFRRAAGGLVTNIPIKKDPPKPAPANVTARNLFTSPVNKDVNPMDRNPKPAPVNVTARNPFTSPVNKDVNPMDRNPKPAPVNVTARNPFTSPVNKNVNPMDRNQLGVNRDPLPFTKHRSPSPLNWERVPRAEPKPFKPLIGLPKYPSPKPVEDKPKNPAMGQTNIPDVTQEFRRMRMYQEATKDLPCKLPPSGRVVVRRFQETNGECENWEQTEVITRDGKIIKFDDVKFNSK